MFNETLSEGVLLQMKMSSSKLSAAYAISLLICLPISCTIHDGQSDSQALRNVHETENVGIFDSSFWEDYPEIEVEVINPESGSPSDSEEEVTDSTFVENHSDSETEAFTHNWEENDYTTYATYDEPSGVYFNITGFTVPAELTYNNAPIEISSSVRVPTSAEAPKEFVQRLIMQAVYEVLVQEKSNVSLTDELTSPNQFTVYTNYNPLECNVILHNPHAANNHCTTGLGNQCFIFEKNSNESMCSRSFYA
ncbi:hypothetical protein KIN20_012985 [Parelaphostrongylus tenuis]|uniref:Uncharacterized protein n=1 Tax=Parelaphostrongylus tenuis TaxID=148309 RepID=A0AAD5QN64_PARTN|nr:hypothetical protein KIN20_012985 [Parelaphostrongylus tenuis]